MGKMAKCHLMTTAPASFRATGIELELVPLAGLADARLAGALHSPKPNQRRRHACPALSCAFLCPLCCRCHSAIDTAQHLPQPWAHGLPVGTERVSEERFTDVLMASPGGWYAACVEVETSEPGHHAHPTDDQMALHSRSRILPAKHRLRLSASCATPSSRASPSALLLPAWHGRATRRRMRDAIIWHALTLRTLKYKPLT